jgi:hypothetical protein
MAINQQNNRLWRISNLDSGDVVEGQFEATGLTENVSANYAEHVALNRKVPILHWLNGQSDTINFQGRLYQKDNDDLIPEEQLSRLKEWTRYDQILQRPPLVGFEVGDGHVEMVQAVILTLGGISYDRVTASGGFRGCAFTITLKRYETFTLDSENEPSGETRYAKSKDTDYYELLAEKEYGMPILGDRLRKRLPDQPVLSTGAVVKLPSIRVMRKETVEPDSIALQGSLTEKSSPTKTLRAFWFDNRNSSRISHIVKD